MYRNLSNAFAILLATLIISGCGNKAMKFYNKGVREFDDEQYSKAIEHFEQALEHGAPPKESDYYLAESYRLSNRIHDAERFYKKAIEEGTTDEHAHFYYGYAQKANGNYEGAKKSFKRYVENGTNFEYLARAKHELKNLKALNEIAKKSTGFVVENCKDLNTEGLDYSPMMHGEELYFTSSRGEGEIFVNQGTRFTDIYQYKFDNITPYSGVAKKVNEVVNTTNRHEAACTFTDGGKTMVFARSNNGKYNDPTQVVDLFETKYVNGEWTEPARLNFNERDSWDSSPCFTPDGKKLYWASNRDGGFGSNDIWVVERFEDGTYGPPENAGEKINTEGEECFPYVAEDNTFYFSSDGHTGFGELDIFKVVRSGGTSKVTNMNRPINSSHDDFAITFRNHRMGYFTSNRPGGKGYDDIYVFKIEIKYFLEVLVTGKVVDENNVITDEEKPLTNALVTIYDSTSNKPIGQYTTDDKGWIRVQVEPEKLYGLTATKAGFVRKSKPYSTIGKSATEEQKRNAENIVFKTKIVLDPVVKDPPIQVVKGEIKLDPIFYPYDKWNITDSASHVLDKLVKIMQEDSTLLIELGSHTDPRNTMKYNDILSQRRATSAVQYILSKGISNDRIYPKGYGERVPLVLKEDMGGIPKGTKLTHKYIKSIKDKKQQDYAYALDRRTEFKIVNFIPEHLKVAKYSDISVERHGEKDEVIEDRKVKYEDQLIKKLEDRKK